MRKLVVFCFLAAVVATTPAGAAEKWNGLYIGIFRGLAFGDEDYSHSAFGSDDLALQGLLAGLAAGYNLRYGQFLFGVDVDGALIDMGDETAPCASPPCRIDGNTVGTVRGRLGWIFGAEDRFAVYVTGGYAVSGWDANFGGAVQQFRLDGWVAGAGAEIYMFGTNWMSSRFEYNYINFGDAESFAAGAGGTGSFDTDAHVFKAGFAFHF